MRARSLFVGRFGVARGLGRPHRKRPDAAQVPPVKVFTAEERKALEATLTPPPFAQPVAKATARRHWAHGHRGGGFSLRQLVEE